MSSNAVTNPFGGPPLPNVNPNYGSQPARSWTDTPSTFTIPLPKLKEPKATKGGRYRTKRGKRRTKRGKRRSKRRL